MTRRIPATGINLFQLIYILIREYKEKSGLEPLNLSLGNPDLVPDERVLALAARFAKDSAYDFHTYAEDKNLNHFAEGMIHAHTGLDVRAVPHLKYVPIAGIKTATALLPLACGLHLPDRKRRDDFTVVSNLPAYDVVGTWSSAYLGANRVVWPLVSADNMRLNVAHLRAALDKAQTPKPDLLFVIRPGNPAAVGANRDEWKAIIELCIERGIRLVNDGAYAALVSGGSHTPLAVVAKDYPALEWAEMFSVSKSFSDPGARLGAFVGSADFVDDFILVKGNTDSGPAPHLMAAYGELFKDRALTQELLSSLRALYQRRLDYVISKLSGAGFRAACTTEAGFFTLWQAPRSVFGRDLAAEAATSGAPLAELVNRTIISETGLVGVHFTGVTATGGPDPLLRYAVCSDVLAPAFQARFEAALARIAPAY